MTSVANDPKRPHRDEDETDDESAEDDDEDARDRDAGAFKRDLEIADEFEPTLDVPLPVSDKPSRKRSRR